MSTKKVHTSAPVIKPAPTLKPMAATNQTEAAVVNPLITLPLRQESRCR